MRPFERSDLGRLYVSPSSRREYVYAGGASLDSVASSASLTYNGRSYGAPSTGKTWTGALTAHSASVLLAMSGEFERLDLLVLYGDEDCPVAPGAHGSAILIEDAIVSGEQWGSLVALSASQRAPLTATCQFVAAGVRRVQGGDTLRLRTTLDGSVVALSRSGGRLYALCAAPSGTGVAITLRLAWTDNARDWNSAPITYGALSEPTSYSLTYRQFAVHAWRGDVYIATGADLLQVRTPGVGEYPAALYAASVRPEGVTSAPIVGLIEHEGFLYAKPTGSGLWRIGAGAPGVLGGVGSSYRGINQAGDWLVFWRSSDAEMVRPGVARWAVDWSDGTLSWVGGRENALVALSSNGGVWTPAANGAWRQRATLGGALIAAANNGEVIYAIVSSGTNGSRVLASPGNPEVWLRLDAGPHDPICLLPVGDGVLVGGHDLVAGANRSSGASSIARCRDAGLLWLAASPELVIAA